MASRPDPDRRTVRVLVAGIVLAFLLGLALMALALRQWGGRIVLGPAPAAPVAEAPLPQVATPMPLPTPSAGQAQAIDLRVADLEGRIARIDLRAAAAAGNAGRAEGLLLSFAARRALDRGVGLGYLETELRDRFGDQPQALGAVISASQAPVTLASLREGLARIEPLLARPQVRDGVWQATKRTLSNLFVVRRAGTETPTADVRLERARLLLEGGQVDRAMAEVARLPSSAPAQAWLVSARRYVEAHRALDQLEAAALTRPVSAPLQGPVQ